jgi:hypothetical protein
MPNCRSLRQGDEYYCPVAGCGLRWGSDEDRPNHCPLAPVKKLRKKP